MSRWTPRSARTSSWCGANASIGARTIVHAGCYVGARARLGDEVLLYPNVTLREECVLGDRVIVHSGAVIGSDGFGFVLDGEVYRKLPQVGNVEVEDDVEIGANVTIDRATTGTTRIGAGSKIDNLVQIAHNVQIGKNCIIVAQVGISGSTVLGHHVVLAGQVGVVGHIEIGDGATVGAQSGVSKSVKPGERLFGCPALPLRQAKRIEASIRHLPELIQTVRKLRRRVDELEGPPAPSEHPEPADPRPVVFDGVGLHTGVACHVEFRPASLGSGIRFVRLDLPGHPEIPVSPRFARADTDHMRRTILKNGNAEVHTVEHILAAAAGLDIDNLIIALNAQEPPSPPTAAPGPTYGSSRRRGSSSSRRRAAISG